MRYFSIIFAGLAFISMPLINCGGCEPPTDGRPMALNAPDGHRIGELEISSDSDFWFRTRTNKSVEGRFYLTNESNKAYGSLSLTFSSGNADFLVTGGSCQEGVAPGNICGFEIEFSPTEPLDNPGSRASGATTFQVRDANNKLLLEKSVSHTQYGSESFMNVPANLQSNKDLIARINSVVATSSGVFIGAPSGVSWSKDGTKWTNFTAADGLPDGVERVQVVDDTIYLLLKNELLKSVDGLRTFESVFQNSRANFTDFAVGNNRIYITSAGAGPGPIGHPSLD